MTRPLIVLVLGTVLASPLRASTTPLRGSTTSPRDVTANFADYSNQCGVDIRQVGRSLVAEWFTSDAERARLQLRLEPNRPLIEHIAVIERGGGSNRTIAQDVDVVTFLTVGSRQAPPGRPPQMSIWNVFFDTPAKRPYRTSVSNLELRSARVTSRGRRATVSLGDLTVGPFRGTLDITLYAASRLIHVEAVVRSDQDGQAIFYDAGLVGRQPGWGATAWMDTAGRLQRAAIADDSPDEPLAVRHRTIMAASDAGTIACFPPPHQFQFPRDLSTNLRFVWRGRGHAQFDLPFGIGIRQHPDGGGAWVPWCNAPPNTDQRLGMFLLVAATTPEETLQEVLRYTHGDRFPDLPGHITFTSHWHMAIAVAAMQQQAQGVAPLPVPDFVRMFQDMNVDAVHLAEFHGDGHQFDTGPKRLPELEAMFAECRRLSDSDLLLIPGEEVNDYLGIKEPGKHPGHWMSLFPKPVYWILRRGTDEPLVEPHAKYGTVYRVGSRSDVMQVLQREGGLAWAAHPRIKASSWTPDIFRHEDFYLADSWLGGAWKAMPADLSRDRLGERCLDLQSDMANWGQKKYMVGEVDVFKIDRTHELYGHMNVNYLRLDRLPRFDEGWQPVLDVLRAGRFFVTTGEVLIREFDLGGTQSGGTTSVGGGAAALRVTASWTFPLRFAEIISGDGSRVYRERIDMAATEPFGQGSWSWRPQLAGRTWVRVELWDVACNGAFTQPIWLEPAGHTP